MKCIFSILFLIFCKINYCQTGKQLHFNFRHIDQFDGLANNTVTSINQDKKGFIWIGTMNGLQRYDGTWFRTYRDVFLEEGGSFAGIEKVSWINGELWVMSGSQMFKYNPSNNQFVTFDPYNFINKSYKYMQFIDGNNKHWFVGEYIVYSFDSLTKKTNYEYTTLVSSTLNHKNLFYDATNKQYWYIFPTGSMVFDVKTKKAYTTADSIKNILPPIIKNKLKQVNLKTMLIDSEHNLWMSTWGGGLMRFNLLTKKGRDYSLNKIKAGEEGFVKSMGPMAVNVFFEDNHKNLWLGTYTNGLLRYDRKNDKFDYVIEDKSNINAIRYNYEVFTIFQDKQENIWVGTDAGISVFNPYNNLFKTISVGENSTPLALNEIEALYQTKEKKIIVGTWGGGSTFFDSTFTFEKSIYFKAYDRNLCWCYIEDSDGNIWGGCQHGYINRFHADGSFKDFIRPAEAGNSTIRCMAKDKAGNIYFGLHNGNIIKWQSQTNKFYGFNFGKPGSTSHNPVTDLFIDNHDNIWACTWNGFYRFDPAKMIFIDSFFSDKSRINSMKNNRPTSIEQLNDSTLIIGYNNGGGGYFNMKSKEFFSWNLNDEISTKTVSSVKEDQYRNVWFTADFGLYNFTPGNERNAVNFLMDKTVVHSPFTSSSFIKSANGQWATATTTELLIFDPVKLEKEKQKSFPVEITGFRIFENPVFIDSFLRYNAPLQLAYNENSITLEFATLNFASLTDVKYFYQLEGLDKDWIDGGRNDFAGYTNLSPGHYTFKVKTVNGNNESPISTLSINISSPFWQTIWFRLLALACIAFLIYQLVLRRIKVIRKESELKQKITETEMAALRAQMNPHFIFNCINAIDNLIQTGEKDNATTYLAMFARLIRNVLDSSKNNIIPFQKDLESIRLYIELEQLRCSNKFSYTIDTDSDLLNGDYKIPPLIIQPFIENAIHHGLLNKESGSGELKIWIFLKEDFINYVIVDNGVGRERAAALNGINKPEHLSYGIAISTERLERYNEDFDCIQITDLYDKNTPVGTKVEINIKTDESKSTI